MSNSILDYIHSFPETVQNQLLCLRNTILKAAPNAEECISYGMPAYKQNGILVYFAGYTNHIGFYPTGSGIQAFKAEIRNYKWSKGTIQFPIDRPLPLSLISAIVKHRVQENEQKKKPITTKNS